MISKSGIEVRIEDNKVLILGDNADRVRVVHSFDPSENKERIKNSIVKTQEEITGEQSLAGGTPKDSVEIDWNEEWNELKKSEYHLLVVEDTENLEEEFEEAVDKVIE